MAAASKSNNVKVKFNQYQHVIAQLFTTDTSDVEFLFIEDDKIHKIRAHTALLAAISPVFKSMFNGNWKENNNIVQIEDANCNAFGAFIQYLYGKETEIEQDNVEALLYLSNKYDVNGLVSRCSSFMIQQMSIENVLSYLNAAIIYDLAVLQDRCKIFISEYTEDILELPEFLSCNKNTLTAILKLEATSCTGLDMFDGCMEWARQRCSEKKMEETGENIRKELGDCFSLISFKDLEFKEFVNICSAYNDGVLSSKEICDLVVHFDQQDPHRYSDLKGQLK